MLAWIKKNTKDVEGSWSLVKGGWNIRSQNYKLQWNICKILFLTYALQVNFGRIWTGTIFIYPKKMLNRKHLPNNLGTKAWEISKPSLHQQPNGWMGHTKSDDLHHFDDEKKTYANHGNPAPKKWSSGWLIIVVSASSLVLGWARFYKQKVYDDCSERTISDWSSSKIPWNFSQFHISTLKIFPTKN